MFPVNGFTGGPFKCADVRGKGLNSGANVHDCSGKGTALPTKPPLWRHEAELSVEQELMHQSCHPQVAQMQPQQRSNQRAAFPDRAMQRCGTSCSPAQLQFSLNQISQDVADLAVQAGGREGGKETHVRDQAQKPDLIQSPEKYSFLCLCASCACLPVKSSSYFQWEAETSIRACACPFWKQGQSRGTCGNWTHHKVFSLQNCRV